MIIVSASDERFVPHFATALHSTWFHNREAHFFLLDCGITSGTLETLAAFAAKLGICLTIVTINTTPFRDLPTSSVWSVAVYARLLIGQILPETCEKAIYLDADCVVTSDLSELWATDISPFLVAGVSDGSALENERRHCGLRSLDRYINAGVMLINLRAWREVNFAERVFARLRERDFRYGEQTGINVVASGRVKILSETWNFMLHRCGESDCAKVTPAIIHCTGFRKPWLYRDAAFVPVYLFHRNSTPFPLSAPSAFYPSFLHLALNLILLRRKYWRHLIQTRRYQREFSVPYLTAVTRMNRSCWDGGRSALLGTNGSESSQKPPAGHRI